MSRPGLIRFAQSLEGAEAYIPLTREQSAASLARTARMLRTSALRLGLIPECQPLTIDESTYADHGRPRLSVTGYLLTCQTCGAELTTEHRGRLAHHDDGTHEAQPA